MRIDAHQHYWSPAHGDYGWLRPELEPLYRDYGPADLHPLLDAAGVAATVLVQAAPTEAETARLLALARQPGSRVAGVVGWCELLAPDAPARIAALAAEPLLKGLRPMLQDLADTQWLLQPGLGPAIAALQTHDLAFDALVQPRHLPVLLAFCQRHPGLRVVIDHGAKPDIAGGGFVAWAEGMARMARETAAVCKLSGLLTEAGPQAPAEALLPYVQHLLAEFGPARLLWGSDWPVLLRAADYARWAALCEAWLAPLPAAAQDRVFGHNAIHFYRLASAPSPAGR